MNDIQTQAIKSAITQIASVLGAEAHLLQPNTSEDGVRAELAIPGAAWGLRFYGLLDRRSVNRDGTPGRPGELVLAVSGCVKHRRMKGFESLSHYVKGDFDTELNFYLRDGVDMLAPLVGLAAKTRSEACKLQGTWEMFDRVLGPRAA